MPRLSDLQKKKTIKLSDLTSTVSPAVEKKTIKLSDLTSTVSPAVEKKEKKTIKLSDLISTVSPVVEKKEKKTIKLSDLISTVSPVVEKKTIKLSDLISETPQLTALDAFNPLKASLDLVLGKKKFPKPVHPKRIIQAIPEIPKGAAHFALRTPQALGTFAKEAGQTGQYSDDFIDKVLTTMLGPGVYAPMSQLKAIKRYAQMKVGLPHKMTDTDKALVSFGKQYQEQNKQWIKKKFPDLGPPVGDAVKSFMFNLGSAGTTAAAAVGISVVTKNPQMAAMLFGLHQKATMYEKAIKKDVKPEKASLLSTVAGGAEYILEKIGLDYMLSKYGSFMKNMLFRTLSEVGQETAQLGAENTIVKLGGIDSTRKIFEGLGQTVGIAFLLGGASSAAISLAEKSGVLKELTNRGLTKPEAKKFVKEVLVKHEKTMNTVLKNELSSIKEENKGTDSGIVAEDVQVEQQETKDSKIFKQGMKLEPEQIKTDNWFNKTMKFFTGGKIAKSMQFFPDIPPLLRNAIRTVLIGGGHNVRGSVFGGTGTKGDYGALFGKLKMKEIDQAVELIFARDTLARAIEGDGDPLISIEQAQKELTLAEERANEKIFASADHWKFLMEEMGEDLLKRGTIKSVRENYAPYKVKGYTEDWMLYQSGIPTRLKKAFRGYAKRAKGSSKERRADVAVLLGHLLRVKMDNLLDDFIATQASEYDIRPFLTREAKVEFFGVSDKGRVRGPNNNSYYDIEGQRYYGYSPDVSVGRRTGKIYLLPKKVYDLFKNFETANNEEIIRRVNQSVGLWKGMAILAHYPAFNVNNMVGDTSLTLLQSPDWQGLLDGVKESILFLSKDVTKMNDFQKRLLAFTGENAILDGTAIVTELTRIRHSSNPLKQVLRKLQRWGELREQLLRVALASQFLKAMDNNNGQFFIDHYSWIDVAPGLSMRDSLGTIARDSMIDYNAHSKAYNRWVRGLAVPFAPWYIKGSILLNKLIFKKPLKIIPLLLAPAVISAIWNYGDEDRRKIEETLPDYVRNYPHFILWETASGNILVFQVQLPQDALLGTKIWSIIPHEIAKVINKEKTVTQAAKDILKDVIEKEGDSISLLNPVVRFIRGLMDGRDPFDHAPIYPMDKRKMTDARIQKHIALYFVKTMVPIFSMTLRQHAKKRPVTLKKVITDFAGKGVLGFREYNKKNEIIIGGIPYDTETYREDHVFMRKEAEVLSLMKDRFVESMLHPVDFFQTEIFSKYMDKIKKLHGETFSEQIFESITDRISSSFKNNTFHLLEKWILRHYDNAETNEDRNALNKSLYFAGKGSHAESFLALPQSVKARRLALNLKKYRQEKGSPL